MSTTYETGPVTPPLSEEEQDEVREQLNRLLETHHFKNSRRYPTLLRFIVEETLEGRGEFLKERLLGVRVFDRPADYDTATDPVVRVTIAEIRKRIAQYYHDEEHDAEMRIELLPGRYAPEFRARGGKKERVPSPSLAAESQIVALPAKMPRRLIRYKLWWVIATGTLCLLGLIAVPGMRWLRPSALDELWGPLIKSPEDILFCIPTDAGMQSGLTVDAKGTPSVAGQKGKNGASGVASFLKYESLGENVVYSDMLAALKIANVVTAYHRDYRVRLNVATSLQDLRQGPVVLIGGMDNQWTMRSLDSLRFHFLGSDQDRFWITDSKNSSFKGWSLDLKQQYGAVTKDYAIVARLHNQQTGQPEMIIAGIGMSGTAAAGEFMADKRRIEELRKRVGRGFADHDFEAVLSTDVVNGIAGSAEIVAVSVW